MPNSSKRHHHLLQSLEQQEFANRLTGSFEDSAFSDSSSDESDQSTSSTIGRSTSNNDSSDNYLSFSDDDPTLSVTFLKEAVLSQRYLSVRKGVPKQRTFEKFLMSMDEDRFRQEIQMSRSAFYRLLDLIQFHNAYHNNSSHAQYPVQLQLLLTLYWLGCFENGFRTNKVAPRFSFSEGAARLFTHRTIVAILSLEKSLVCWSSSAEKIIIKQRIENQSGFPNCLGFVDGTLPVLESRPSLQESDFSGRKKQYVLSMLIACDDQHRIRYLFTGFCGSVHDSRVLKESKWGMETYSFNSSIDRLIVWLLITMSCKIDCMFACLFDRLIHWLICISGKSPGLFSAEAKYILADSCYATTSTIGASFKKPTANLEENVTFNHLLSHIRMRVEHCNGILKGRFQCLRGLRNKIRNKNDHRRAVYWIRSCAVLHNFLISDFYDETWTEHSRREADLNSGNDLRETIDSDRAGVKKREEVKKIVFKKICLRRNGFPLLDNLLLGISSEKKFSTIIISVNFFLFSAA